MRDLIPGLGDKKARDRLDELFNRQTLGSVIFGGHVNKVFERLYNIIAISIVLYVLGVDLWTTFAVALLLLALWFLGTIASIYLFVKWESIIERAEDAADSAKEKASDAKEKAEDAVNQDEE